ncbi:hypothetical protein HBR94_10405 [Pseudomonas sp. WS 5412]|uniref:hypothetical protein n=1 Tax=Pseudomonas sp. WS 5412 TaxID=2717487 RepID=UPI001475B213|nr:hypothetical protein [Pseudomonas sp. WS 5412]NMY31909.1 hypothetical protein [Pseudomonas sp. WS 5412]
MKRLLALFAGVLVGCGNSERADSEVVIDESALSTYSKEHYPKTYEQWGESGVDRIKAVERSALMKAAKQRICDRVEYVGLSEQLSSPPSKIVVYADCLNRWRFYIDGDSNILSSERTK